MRSAGSARVQCVLCFCWYSGRRDGQRQFARLRCRSRECGRRKIGKKGAGDVEDVRARRGASKAGKTGGDEALEDAPMQIRTLLFPPDCRAADSLVGPLVEPAVEFVVSVGLRQLVTIR